MTEDEFWEFYARRSGFSVEELRGMGMRALPCACNEPACRGWKMDMTAAVESEVLRRIKRAHLAMRN